MHKEYRYITAAFALGITLTSCEEVAPRARLEAISTGRSLTERNAANLPPGSIITTDSRLARPTSQVVIGNRKYGYIDDRTVWSFVEGQPKVIPVCWENAGADREKGLVRDAIATTWEANSGLKFRGWNTCPVGGFNGIRILHADDGPRTLGLGTQIRGIKDGMLLNFTFKVWGTSCANKIDQCIVSIAVHEFGHAIGMAHEQNRPDTPAKCKGQAQGGNGTIMIDKWEESSALDYCNPIYNNDGKLSLGDIHSVQFMYCSNSNPKCLPKILDYRKSL